MGKTILTPKQSHFLELIQSEPQITKRFYLTGGTALSEFYLHHRLSYDIDLFTEKDEVNQSVVNAFLQRIASDLKIVEIKRSQFLGLFSYMLIFDDGEELKVDFNYYPFPRIQKGTTYKNLEIDSIYDIAANKIQTIFTKARSRDYIDLYLIMQERNYALDRLILDAQAKFDWDIDRITLASQFIKVKDMDETPMLIVPFDKKALEKFFLELATSLKQEIFK